MSYLRGPSDTPFTRGPYLLRVSGSEAALRWRVRGGKAVRADRASRPTGRPVDVAGGVLRGLQPDTRYSWVASVDGTRAGQRLVHHAAAQRSTGSVRFAVLADYGSGNDNEWAVGRVLAAQRPEFAVTAGDNSYLVAAEVLLDRNIFRPLGDLMRQRADVRLPRRPRQLLARARAPSAARSTSPRAAASRCTTGPIQVVVLGDEPNEPAAHRVRPQRRCASPARRCASSPATARCSPATPILPVCARAARRPSSRGHLHRYERRTVDGVQTFTVGTGGQGPGSLDHTKATPGADVSLLDIGALMVDVRADGTSATRISTSTARVLDHVVDLSACGSCSQCCSAPASRSSLLVAGAPGRS